MLPNLVTTLEAASFFRVRVSLVPLGLPGRSIHNLVEGKRTRWFHDRKSSQFGKVVN
jgi:hypothetical protein